MLFVNDGDDGTGTATTLIRGVARASSSGYDMVAPSNEADLCDINDGLFGLCGARQLH